MDRTVLQLLWLDVLYAQAYVRLGWLFWLLPLGIMCVAEAGFSCCRFLETIGDGSGRIWSVGSNNSFHDLHNAVSSFQGHVKSHCSKATQTQQPSPATYPGGSQGMQKGGSDWQSYMHRCRCAGHQCPVT